MNEPKKYSLWVVPGGAAGQQIQALISGLAAEFAAPDFVPHLSVVANILAGNSEMPAVQERVSALAAQFQPFDITLTGYGYKDEEFRCLYLLAEPSPEIAALYAAATVQFPQVAGEHFAGMPHVSVLYGTFDTAIKKGIIGTHPITPVTFTVTSLDVYHTNNPVESWKLSRTFPLGA